MDAGSVDSDSVGGGGGASSVTSAFSIVCAINLKCLGTFVLRLFEIKRR